jgi:hypothetical protein
MSKRINIVLPDLTLQTIDRLVKPGQRSSFIDTAVRHYVANRSVEALRVQMERAAVRDRDLDSEVAADWFGVDQHTWQQLDEPNTLRKSGTPGGARSISRRSTRP